MTNVRCFFDPASKTIPTPERADGAADHIWEYTNSLLLSSISANRLLAKISGRRLGYAAETDGLGLMSSARFYARLLRRKGSNTHELTGSRLTRDFHAQLVRECETYLRGKDKGEGFAFVCMDINDMTGFNAAGGYEKGNEALRGSSTIIRNMLLELGQDVVLYGFGDDFKFILHGIEPAAVEALLEKMKKRIAAEIFPEMGFSIAAGSVCVPQLAIKNCPSGYNVLFGDEKIAVPAERLGEIALKAVAAEDAVLLAYSLSKICHTAVYLDKHSRFLNKMEPDLRRRDVRSASPV